MVTVSPSTFVTICLFGNSHASVYEEENRCGVALRFPNEKWLTFNRWKETFKGDIFYILEKRNIAL